MLPYETNDLTEKHIESPNERSGSIFNADFQPRMQRAEGARRSRMPPLATRGLPVWESTSNVMQSEESQSGHGEGIDEAAHGSHLPRKKSMSVALGWQRAT